MERNGLTSPGKWVNGRWKGGELEVEVRALQFAFAFFVEYWLQPAAALNPTPNDDQNMTGLKYVTAKASPCLRQNAVSLPQCSPLEC